jgi:heme/copper-type cytochrome/quinol oxidase subunit 2
VRTGLSVLVVIAIEICVVAFFVTGWILWRRRQQAKGRATQSSQQTDD